MIPDSKLVIFEGGIMDGVMKSVPEGNIYRFADPRGHAHVYRWNGTKVPVVDKLTHLPFGMARVFKFSDPEIERKLDEFVKPTSRNEGEQDG